MVQHAPTPKTGVDHPEQIPGYTYGTTEAATSPLTLEDLDRLKAAVGLTADDEDALRDAAAILAGQADDMVIAWPAQLRQQPWLGGYSGHPDGAKKNCHRPRRLPPPHPHAVSLRLHHVVVTSSRGYLAATGVSAEDVDRVHAAFTNSVMRHVTVWTRPYDAAANWSRRRGAFGVGFPSSSRSGCGASASWSVRQGAGRVHTHGFGSTRPSPDARRIDETGRRERFE
jgi:hypothetical protein